MQSIYNVDEFGKAQRKVELAKREMHTTSQEHLAEVLKVALEDINLIHSKSNNREFLIAQVVRNAMTEAIRTREATATYTYTLEML